MKQPTARTSPIASKRSRSSASRAAPSALELAHVLEHRLALEDLERRQRRGAGGGQPGPGAAGGHVVEAAQRALGAEQRADRHRAAAERLAEADQVGLDAPALDREQLARAARSRS